MINSELENTETKDNRELKLKLFNCPETVTQLSTEVPNGFALPD